MTQRNTPDLAAALAIRPYAIARMFHPQESHIKVVSVYHQEQEFSPARFCNAGVVKKTRGVCGPPGPVMEPALNFLHFDFGRHNSSTPPGSGPP